MCNRTFDQKIISERILIDLKVYTGHYLLDGVDVLGTLSNLQSYYKVLNGLDVLNNINMSKGHKMLDRLSLLDGFGVLNGLDVPDSSNVFDGLNILIFSACYIVLVSRCVS